MRFIWQTLWAAVQIGHSLAFKKFMKPLKLPHVLCVRVRCLVV